MTGKEHEIRRRQAGAPVAQQAAGKEHDDIIVEEILKAAGLESLS